VVVVGCGDLWYVCSGLLRGVVRLCVVLVGR